MTAVLDEHYDEGDHKSVLVPTAETSVEFVMASALTSSSDTETSKYFDNVAKTVKQFDLVADKDVQITKINDITLTDPIPVDGNKSYGESKGRYNKITVKTTVATTVITARMR